MTKLQTISRSMLADLHTPVSLFYKIRASYPEVLLLESSDYSSKEDSTSFICFQSIVSFRVQNDGIDIHRGKEVSHHPIKNLVTQLDEFRSSIYADQESHATDLFGYTSFDSIPYFETLTMTSDRAYTMPEVRYDVFKYVIVFDHFYGKLTLHENLQEGEVSHLDDIVDILQSQSLGTFGFSCEEKKDHNTPSDQFLENVRLCKEHCQRGDIFQIVPSRRFERKFTGDEFNVYRALRSINPSPYLFYYDYASYKIFGSSPEAQLTVNDKQEAEIHPIAGTVKRIGVYEEDRENMEMLKLDPKENAEHTMLVDLARNDLSKNCSEVYVAAYKDVQFFSHVIHLVSKVRGKITKGTSAYQILADTFPAGTLSGAPKYRALQIIDELEPQRRGFYGGAIGMIGRTSGINHAIIIRSFLSYEGKLYYQAGAGIVIDSVPERELNEVDNKIAALDTAINQAQNL